MTCDAHPHCCCRGCRAGLVLTADGVTAFGRRGITHSSVAVTHPSGAECSEVQEEDSSWKAWQCHNLIGLRIERKQEAAGAQRSCKGPCGGEQVVQRMAQGRRQGAAWSGRRVYKATSLVHGLKRLLHVHTRVGKGPPPTHTHTHKEQQRAPALIRTTVQREPHTHALVLIIVIHAVALERTQNSCSRDS